MESFKATAHYGDWAGTVAADLTDVSAIEDFLEKRGLASPRGSLVAIKASIDDEHGTAQRTINVRAFYCDGQDFESIKSSLAATKGPAFVREVAVEMTLAEFLEFFESFELTLTWADVGLDGRQFDVVH